MRVGRSDIEPRGIQGPSWYKTQGDPRVVTPDGPLSCVVGGRDIGAVAAPALSRVWSLSHKFDQFDVKLRVYNGFSAGQKIIGVLRT